MDKHVSKCACGFSDVRCGKLQCSASERFPIIGSSRQSTSYRFNGVNCRYSRVVQSTIQLFLPVYCLSVCLSVCLGSDLLDISRGAAVSLGDDVPDPGVVQDGTKCGENKVMLRISVAPIAIPLIGMLYCVCRSVWQITV